MPSTVLHVIDVWLTTLQPVAVYVVGLESDAPYLATTAVSEAGPKFVPVIVTDSPPVVAESAPAATPVMAGRSYWVVLP